MRLPTSLFFTSKSRGIIGVLRLDAVIEEAPTFEGKPTSHPVERGVAVSDHYIQSPDKLVMRGIVSDYPARLLGGLHGILEGKLPGLPGDVVDAFRQGEGTSSRSLGAFRALKALKESGEPFDVVTGLQVYRSMVFTNLSPTRNASTGRSLQFTAEMVQVRIVSGSIVGIPVETVAEGSADLAASEVQVGRQSGQALGAGEEEDASILYNLLRPVIE